MGCCAGHPLGVGLAESATVAHGQVPGIGAALWDPRVSVALYVLVACIGFVPDRRIERVVSE